VSHSHKSHTHAHKAGKASEIPCDVGTAMVLEWKGKKFNSAYRGQKKPEASSFAPGGGATGFFLVDTPLVAGKVVVPEYNAPITVRFLYDGVIYGFTSYLSMAHGRGSLLMLEHPKNIEKHPLRKLERIKTVIRAEAVVVQKQQKVSGVILDFSQSGAKLGLETGQGFETGDNLLLSFTLGDGTEITALEATVRNNRTIGDKVVYGTSFNPSSNPSMEKLNSFYTFCVE
jgi:c-di-GMP-binding flagellar brake protein YcgR